MIQYKYTPDAEVILLLIQIQIQFRYGCHPDTYSYFNYQIQIRYAPDAKAILFLIHIKLLDTVQIHSRHECHSATYSIQYGYTPDTEVILLPIQYSSDTLQIWIPSWYLFRFQLSDTVQIRSRYGCHYDTHSIQLSDTVQIRSRYGCHPDTYSDFNYQIQFKYALDTDVILILIQILTIRYSSYTLQTHKSFCHLFRF